MKTTKNQSCKILKKQLCLMMLVLLMISPLRAQNLSSRPDDATDPMINPGPKQEAIGSQAMVSTQVPAATEEAVKIMRNGGNAFDAGKLISEFVEAARPTVEDLVELTIVEAFEFATCEQLDVLAVAGEVRLPRSGLVPQYGFVLFLQGLFQGIDLADDRADFLQLTLIFRAVLAICRMI